MFGTTDAAGETSRFLFVKNCFFKTKNLQRNDYFLSSRFWYEIWNPMFSHDTVPLNIHFNPGHMPNCFSHFFIFTSASYQSSISMINIILWEKYKHFRTAGEHMPNVILYRCISLLYIFKIKINAVLGIRICIQWPFRIQILYSESWSGFATLYFALPSIGYKVQLTGIIHKFYFFL